VASARDDRATSVAGTGIEELARGRLMHTIAESTDTDVTDLLARAARGDQPAWTALTRRFAPLLWSRVRQYRLQDADGFDVVQTTWMYLAENLHRIHSPAHLAGWLSTVASRECLRALKRNSRAVLSEDVMDGVADRDTGPEGRAVASAVETALRTAVAELPPHRRALIAALFADDRKPYAEVARELGVPIGSLGPTRARTLAELRRVLQARGFAE
jgi:RNA polymerase sigma factor (sigma-70 family)